ncbi:hypothetical protein AR457_03570 [Streptomyces agglomeratus]|uniref:Secreted protein n=1 Tax=Streptomyces agglomeratus TaxID=285458 RepID=A0A1E5P2E3_9ACTN|nr:hypothetical protein [Streptomyces agglomeratus]OEJ23711.1 hypothetical protein AS594_03675 [Streptomyces agglomeratus]OEJ43303.1 hypothetical protein AR457_03570 [Streptomyces agglomeratus]OEJ54778.1 hypothetical protein BGK72_32200 [Streptomyces agglomeratus]OEJ62151.1 hypothetical protein BGM19_33105 [Streptomyces agglomeratus]
MIKTKSVLAAAALAAGFSALAAPAAGAADTSGRYLVSVPDALDNIGASAVPAERRAEVPSVTGQLNGLSQLDKLSELQQFTGLVAPVTGVLPAME